MEILIWLGCAFVCVMIAPSKNRNPVSWFFWGVLGGLISIIVLVVLPPIGESKVCQYCGEKILKEATVCKHCKKEVSVVL